MGIKKKMVVYSCGHVLVEEIKYDGPDTELLECSEEPCWRCFVPDNSK